MTPEHARNWVRELAAEPAFGTWRNARARAGVSDLARFDRDPVSQFTP